MSEENSASALSATPPLPGPPTVAEKTAAPIAKPPKPPKAVPAFTLDDALQAARAGLGDALRALIAARVPDGNTERNRIENAFESVKNRLAKVRGAQPEDLKEAFAALQHAAGVLANHSSIRAEQLAGIRAAAAAAQKHLVLLKIE